MRGKILDMAKAIINGERNDQYGEPENAFGLVALFWGAYLDHIYQKTDEIEPRDVAIMMVLFKIARLAHQKGEDSLVDAVGYLALAGDMEQKEAL